MNGKQKFLVWVGMLFVFLALLFPPFHIIEIYEDLFPEYTGSKYFQEDAIQYAFVGVGTKKFRTHMNAFFAVEPKWGEADIAWDLLALEILVAFALISGVVALAGSTKSQNAHEEESLLMVEPPQSS